MTTVIKLDTQAMNTLFPEGSEARVKLQNAVIKNFSETLFPAAIGTAMTNQIAAAVGEVVNSEHMTEIDAAAKEAVSEYFQTRFSGLSLLNKGQEKLRVEAKKVASNALHSSVHDVLHKELVECHAEIEKKVKELAPFYLKDFSDEKVKEFIKKSALELVTKAAEGLTDATSD